MAKKSRTDILEKLSALNPSEPTRTRGKAARRPAAKKAGAQKAASAKKPGPAAPSGKPKTPPPPRPEGPPSMNSPLPGFAGYPALGDVSKIYEGIYESWFQIIRSCSGMAADCNSIILRSLTYFMRPGRWGRF